MNRPTVKHSPLVEKFCTIPDLPLTDFDNKAVSNAELFSIPFEGEKIQCYSWGNGKTILLAHGWGSRASHFAAIARILSSSGFRVVAFDAPGHSSIKIKSDHNYSNMFEFYRAISAVAKEIAPIYGLVGHSLGAAASVLAISDHLNFCNYKIDLAKLILISSPSGVGSIVNSFCRNSNLTVADEILLTEQLTKEFNFQIEDCSITSAIGSINSEILVIHDYDDDEILIKDAEEIIDSSDKIKAHFTKGTGHFKILTNRSMISAIKDFLLSD